MGQPKQRPEGPRFVFSGHAVGAAAQFDRLGETPVHHAIPALGASVLPPTGGVSKAEVNHFSFEVSHPERRNLLSVHRIETMAAGRVCGTRYETETEARIESITIANMLHIDFVRVHVLAVREGMEGEPATSSEGNRIVGVQLGTVKAEIELDQEAMNHCGNRDRLARYLGERGETLAERDGICTYSLVRNIALSGPEKDLDLIDKFDNSLHWEGFGWIFFGRGDCQGARPAGHHGAFADGLGCRRIGNGRRWAIQRSGGARLVAERPCRWRWGWSAAGARARGKRTTTPGRPTSAEMCASPRTKRLAGPSGRGADPIGPGIGNCGCLEAEAMAVQDRPKEAARLLAEPVPDGPEFTQLQVRQLIDRADVGGTGEEPAALLQRARGMVTDPELAVRIPLTEGTAALDRKQYAAAQSLLTKAHEWQPPFLTATPWP